MVANDKETAKRFALKREYTIRTKSEAIIKGNSMSLNRQRVKCVSRKGGRTGCGIVT